MKVIADTSDRCIEDPFQVQAVMRFSQAPQRADLRLVHTDDGGGEAGSTGLTRMATILPVLRMTIQTTVIVITILLALSQLGVNTTLLLVSAEGNLQPGVESVRGKRNQVRGT